MKRKSAETTFKIRLHSSLQMSQQTSAQKRLSIDSKHDSMSFVRKSMILMIPLRNKTSRAYKTTSKIYSQLESSMNWCRRRSKNSQISRTPMTKESRRTPLSKAAIMTISRSKKWIFSLETNELLRMEEKKKSPGKNICIESNRIRYLIVKRN